MRDGQGGPIRNVAVALQLKARRQVIYKIRKDRHVGLGAKYVVSILADLGCDSQGWTRTTAKELSEMAGYCRRVIFRWFAELKAAGWLESSRQGRATRYRIRQKEGTMSAPSCTPMSEQPCTPKASPVHNRAPIGEQPCTPENAAHICNAHARTREEILEINSLDMPSDQNSTDHGPETHSLLKAFKATRGKRHSKAKEIVESTKTEPGPLYRAYTAPRDAGSNGSTG